MLVMIERLYLFFSDTKARTLLLTPLFPCVCVHSDTKKHLRGVFFFWVWDGSARYGFQWLCGLLRAFVLWLLDLLLCFYYITCHIPSFLKIFPFFFNLFFLFGYLNAL